MTYKLSRALTATLLIVGLGACSPSTEAPTHGDNYTDTRADPADDETPTATATRAPEPEPSPTGDANMAAALPEKAPAPDEQLMDDASATGMTARTSRNDQTNPSAPSGPTEIN